MWKCGLVSHYTGFLHKDGGRYLYGLIYKDKLEFITLTKESHRGCLCVTRIDLTVNFVSVKILGLH